MKRCVVAIATHTADAELGAGGTLARYAAAGYRCLIVVVTTSVGPQPLGEAAALTVSELADWRRREAGEAAAVLGCEVRFLGWNERFYWHRGVRHCVDFAAQAPDPIPPGRGFFSLVTPDTKTMRAEVEELLVGEEPELILTHSVNDMDHDHWLTARSVAPAYAEAARHPGVRLGRLLSWETEPRQCAFQLHVANMLDISDFRQQKHAAIGRLASRVDAERLAGVQRREAHWGTWLRGLTPAAEPYAEAFTDLCSRSSLAPTPAT